ncbi:MAG: hypothetical protein GWN00_29480, partial [Aliifodinibius sp.]|nr:hypothetical protein [Fodinibius sp.]NIV14911.1 hypothetical protein [Fodinibius sp.]NIY28770.1 hypothetical protein [Fodinibius sp.]
NWSIDDINESYALWTVLGIGLDGEDNPAIITPNGFYRVRGTQYFYTWQEAKAGFGTIPMKDTSAAHDGSSYSSECPFLQDDSGD